MLINSFYGFSLFFPHVKMIRKKAPHRGAFPMDPMEVKKWHS